MTDIEKELCSAAVSSMHKAYAPYSGFMVGAALLAASGKVYTGCNIENASYTPTVCAERTAFFKAVCDGERNFVMLAVCGGKGGVISDAITPCGVCRQVMSEFCSPSFRVLVMASENSFVPYTLSELLPASFTSRSLHI